MNNEVLVDYANKTTRFFNHVIDILFFWILWIAHVFLFDVETVADLSSGVVRIIYFTIFFFLYHFLFELLFGRTIGKFITGTKVIDEDGNKPNFLTLLVRNAGRLIPFNAISFLLFKAGWHDAISKTTVVNT